MLDINYIYTQISDELKKQPELNPLLHSIEEYLSNIENDNRYEGVRSEFIVENDKISIKIFYSYFSENSKTTENYRRTGTMYDISLNQEGGLTILESCGDFQIGIIYNMIGTLYKYNYEQINYKKNSDEIISHQKLIPTQVEIGNILDWKYMPLNIKEQGIYDNYESYDTSILTQIEERKPKIENGKFVKVSDYLNNYVAWSAIRNQVEPNKASITEFIKLDKDYELTTKEIYNKPVINMSYPPIMRIEQPYAAKCYTKQEIKALIDMKYDIVNNQEFYNSVLEEKYLEYIKNNGISK